MVIKKKKKKERKLKWNPGGWGAKRLSQSR